MQLLFARFRGLCGNCFVVAAMALVLAACGGGSGGGGSDSGSGSDSLAEDPRSLDGPVSLPESDSTAFEVSGAHKLKAQPQVSEVEITRIRPGVFRVRVFDIDRPISLTLEALSEDGSVVKSASVQLENTSGRIVERQADLIASQPDVVIDLPEDRRYVAHVLDLAYLRGDITNAQKRGRLTTYDDRVEDWKSRPESWVSYVESALHGYRQGSEIEMCSGVVDELCLESAVDIFSTALAEAGDMNLTNIDRAIPESADFAPDIRATTIEYSAEARTYSRFYGDERFGQSADSGFGFDDSFVWLREIAQDSGRLMCSVDSTSL